jgi:hypothetical protein
VFHGVTRCYAREYIEDRYLIHLIHPHSRIFWRHSLDASWQIRRSVNMAVMKELHYLALREQDSCNCSRPDGMSTDMESSARTWDFWNSKHDWSFLNVITEKYGTHASQMSFNKKISRETNSKSIHRNERYFLLLNHVYVYHLPLRSQLCMALTACLYEFHLFIRIKSTHMASHH